LCQCSPSSLVSQVAVMLVPWASKVPVNRCEKFSGVRSGWSRNSAHERSSSVMA
jgi:hypothetical protein